MRTEESVMRKKLKPDLNLEEIQQSVIDEVVSQFQSGMSMRKIATGLSMSAMKVRKILITAGAFTSQQQKNIEELYKGGYNIEEIADIFHMSQSSVYSYLAYETVMYNLDEKSVNADRQARYRERKKQNLKVEKPKVIKPEIKRKSGSMYIVVNQRLRRYLPKEFCSADRDPLERTYMYGARETDPDGNIWAADVVISGRGKDRRQAIAMENARCGFRIVMDMPKELQEMEPYECRECLAEKMEEKIREELLLFGVPENNVDDYICNNSYQFIFVKSKPSFPSQNVEEFAEQMQAEIKEGLAFDEVFERAFNRTTRKYGNVRVYRDVDLATYQMLGLSSDETMEIIKKRWESIMNG